MHALLAVQINTAKRQIRFIRQISDTQITIRNYEVDKGFGLYDLGTQLEKSGTLTRFPYGNVCLYQLIAAELPPKMYRPVYELLTFYTFSDTENGETLIATLAPEPKRRTRQIKSQIPS